MDELHTVYLYIVSTNCIKNLINAYLVRIVGTPYTYLIQCRTCYSLEFFFLGTFGGFKRHQWPGIIAVSQREQAAMPAQIIQFSRAVRVWPSTSFSAVSGLRTCKSLCMYANLLLTMWDSCQWGSQARPSCFVSGLVSDEVIAVTLSVVATEPLSTNHSGTCPYALDIYYPTMMPVPGIMTAGTKYEPKTKTRKGKKKQVRPVLQQWSIGEDDHTQHKCIYSYVVGASVLL